MQTLIGAGAFAYFHGDVDGASTFLDAGIAAARSLDDPFGLALALYWRCSAAAAQGDWDRVAALATEGAEIARRFDMPNWLGAHLGALAVAERGRGNLVQARALATEAVARMRAAGYHRGLCWTLICLGETLRALGEWREAALVHLEGLTLTWDKRERWGLASELRSVTSVLAEGGQREAAARLCGSLDRLGAELGVILGSDWDALKRTADALRAGLGREAFAAACAAGAARPIEEVVRDVRAALEAIAYSAAPRRPAAERFAYPAELSEREVEVLRLVAAGLSNAEVADRLYVSRRTVDAHLQRIYGKLDVSTRAAATRFAVERGLV
jgi:DNA-binding CsgD family transcriptional regulator